MSNQLLYSIGGSNSSSFSTSKYPPDSVTNFVAESSPNLVRLTWTDPEDLTLVDGTVIKWAYTRIVRKAGSVPENMNDGVVVVNNAIRNQYQETPYQDTSVINNTTYYYVAFSVSETGGINTEGPVVSAMPESYYTMTVIINEADSNPATCCSYADDAVDMTSGKDATAWAEFFGYKPCLFKDGQVVGYLNPNNYAQFEDGTPADITSGDAGDVMVEFPRRGVKISKSGNLVTVSMTDNPDDPDFTYYAHSRGESRRDYFYLGAYLGRYGGPEGEDWISYSGYKPFGQEYITTLTNCRNYAHNRGSGYEIMTFYQLTFLQVMYLLQFKNLSCSTAVGYGYGGLSNDRSNQAHNTGVTNTSGMIYGTQSYQPMKLFGIEDLWGNLEQWVDGCIMDNREWKVATDNFNDDGTGYKSLGYRNYWVDGITSSNNFTSKVVGNTDLGFIPIECNGSQTTYYGTFVSINSVSNQAYCYIFGSSFIDSYWKTGLFSTHISQTPASSSSNFLGARLSYY